MAWLLALSAFASAPALAQRPEPVPFSAAGLPELGAELDSLEARGELWGIVLIADGDEVIFHRAYGLADRDLDRANTTGTAFNIASVGKNLTAALVLRLAQGGDLDLDAPIGRWIDGLPGRAGDEVTVRHLLRMESGWGDYMLEPAYRDDPKRFRTVADYAELIRTIAPASPPGAERIYSNVGYELLGAVIEEATGRPYDEVLRERVLEPAGMSESGCFVHEPAAGRAVPYTEAEDGALTSALPRLAYRCSPAGGAYATSGDLLRFQLAVVDGVLLDEHHTRLLLNGFEEGEDDAERFGFVGGTHGVNTWVLTTLATGTTVVVLANMDPPAAERVMLGLQEWVREHPFSE